MSFIFQGMAQFLCIMLFKKVNDFNVCASLVGTRSNAAESNVLSKVALDHLIDGKQVSIRIL
jgi:hypothetical protein